jgi:hypothetical protein
MINGEECVAMFEGLIVDEVRPHSSGATFSKSRTLQDVAQLSDSQTAAATWVSEMHSAAHQEGKYAQFHEKPAVLPTDIRNLESASVWGPSASSADTLRIFARDLAKVQALKQEVEAFMLEGIQHPSGSARRNLLWHSKLDAKRKRLERIDRQEIQLHEFKDELVALKCAASEVLDAATIKGAEADRADIHSRVESQLVKLECRVRAVQASWADHNYEKH